MSEILRAPKYITVALAAGVGISALTGCSGENDRWEVGVVCPNDDKVVIKSADEGIYDGDYDIDLDCVSQAGKMSDPLGLELIHGEGGSVIKNNIDYSDTVVIEYNDIQEGTGESPKINLNNYGFDEITLSGVEVYTTAVKGDG